MDFQPGTSFLQQGDGFSLYPPRYQAWFVCCIFSIVQWGIQLGVQENEGYLTCRVNRPYNIQIRLPEAVPAQLKHEKQFSLLTSSILCTSHPYNRYAGCQLSIRRRYHFPWPYSQGRRWGYCAVKKTDWKAFRSTGRPSQVGQCDAVSHLAVSGRLKQC